MISTKKSDGSKYLCVFYRIPKFGHYRNNFMTGAPHLIKAGTERSF